jgi:hypothetical protein
VRGHPLDVDRGGGDDQLEVGRFGRHLAGSQQEVDVEAPLVRLVEDIVSYWRSYPVVRDLGEQHAVGHELDQRGSPHVVVEAHLVAHDVARGGLQLLGDPLGDGAGGDPARLGVPDPAAHAAAELEGDLGQLGGLARARSRPATTTTWWSRSAAAMSSRRALTGSSAG